MDNDKENPISFLSVLKAFLIFITLQFFVAPAIFLAGYWWTHGIAMSPTKAENPLITGWFNTFGMILTAFGLFFYVRSLFPSPGLDVWASSKKVQGPWYNDFFFGVKTILLAYPVVIVVELITIAVLGHFGHDVQHDQVAVHQVKGVLNEFPLLLSLALSICIFVPFVEELLFRGFLQQWLKKYFSIAGAIFITSIFFSSVHFSTDQGMSNIPLIISLFILSCILGFVREYKASVWASMGLHSAFNAISIALLVATS